MDRVLTARLVNQGRSLIHTTENQADQQCLIRPNGHVDRGWAWIVVLGSSIAQLLVIILLSSFGLLYVPMIEEFHTSIEIITIAGNLLFGMTYLTVALATPVCDRVGCRVLTCIGALFMFGSFFTGYFVLTLPGVFVIGALSGLGAGLLLACSLMVINSYFEKKRHIAYSLILAANGMGGVVGPPFVTFLLEEFELRSCLLLLSVLYLNGLVGGMLLRPVPVIDRNHNKHQIQPRKSRLREVLQLYTIYVDKALVKNVLYYMCAFSCYFYNNGYNILYAILPDYIATQTPFSLEDASMALLLAGLSNTVGKLVSMFYIDRCQRMSRVMYVTSCCICGLSLLLIPLAVNVEHYYAASIGFGFFYGCIHYLGSILFVEFFGPDKLSGTFGMSYVCYTISAFTGNPMAGVMSDITSLEAAKFYVAGSCVVLSGVVMAPAIFMSITRKGSLMSSEEQSMTTPVEVSRIGPLELSTPESTSQYGAISLTA